ncbi:MAG: GntR family transcriptional regulator [Candidatus Devosia symbiotica]|nr:GntR family transcriptional regulator [Candidatus Devosia symbiotica]
MAIARARILSPSVLVADEFISMLDATFKAQIIGLLKELQAKMGMSMLFISHDLSTVKSLTDSVVVMYRGRILEEAPTWWYRLHTPGESGPVRQSALSYLEPLGTRTRGVAILDIITDMVERSGLRVGDRLPPEISLAATLSVGRSTIREVLNR